ncbi:MAG: nitronate monooxygenase [Desulfobacterales bacterium]|nr:nitronate monooxygenase [Desulfobacterales bacterium]
MKIPELKLGDLKVRIPIIQGGMGVGISLSGLAAAVANEGGIGVIASAMIGMSEPDIFDNSREANGRALRREIRKARELTDGILGINIMGALTNYEDIVKLAIEEGIDIIFSGAGLPLDLPSYLQKGVKTKLFPIVSSGRAARIICRKWESKYNYLPDAFVVEGPMAGGHLGFKPEQLDDPAFALENLVPEVIEAIRPFEEKSGKSIKVIAAGGVYTGEDIFKYLEMGAAGVQMGTRFVATHECDADIRFKQSYIKATEDDLVIIKSPVGLPGRAIKGKFLDDVNSGKRKPFKCPYQCVSTCNYQESPYCIAFALISAKKGNLNSGFAFAGSNAYRVEEIMSVKELIGTLIDEYESSSASDILSKKVCVK